jgi:sugar lactone lactonase YvrE
MFGGPDFETLYVTSAGMGRESEPEAGNLFALQPDVRGLPETRFAG